MSDEELAENPPDPIAYQVAARLARLALLISQADARKRMLVSAGAVDARAMTRWEHRSDEARAAMTAGAVRIVQAMRLLGFRVVDATGEDPT